MRKLRSTVLVAGLATLAAAGLTMAPTSAGAQEIIDVSGDASGLTVGVNVLGVGPVNVGPLPVANTPPGESQQVLAVSQPGVVDAAILGATSQPTGEGVTSAAQVVGADVLAGAVTADVITATCSSDAGGSTGNSSLVNAGVLGTPVSVTPPANTQVPLPLLGTVFLNEQMKSDSPGSTSMTVNAVRVALTGGLLGGDILISHAGCAASGPSVSAGAGGGNGGGGGGGGGGGAGGPGTAGPASAVTGNPTFAG